MKNILGCTLEIRLLSFQITVKGFISVNQIIFFRKMAEEKNNNMIEGLKKFKSRGWERMVLANNSTIEP